MAAPWQGLPVRLERAPHRGAAFALSNSCWSNPMDMRLTEIRNCRRRALVDRRAVATALLNRSADDGRRRVRSPFDSDGRYDYARPPVPPFFRFQSRGRQIRFCKVTKK